jgi:hypothetical protein
VVRACNSSYSEGWGRRITWAQEFQASLGNTVISLFRYTLNIIYVYIKIVQDRKVKLAFQGLRTESGSCWSRPRLYYLCC